MGDDPIASASQDRLDRRLFAERAAELIENVAALSPSSVAGLIGPWGSGKSSVLGMVQERLSENSDWRVVTFNPWEVSDLPSVVREFMLTLGSALPAESSARRALAGYTKKIAPFTSLVSVVGIDPSRAIDALGDSLLGDQSLSAKRRELERALSAQPNRVLVLLDDIDRLQADELTLILKLVRLVGRLPKVIYVLAYDEQTLLDVLATTDLAGHNPTRALAYLDKIVQLRLDLPPVTQYRIRALVTEALELVMGQFEIAWSREGLEKFRAVYQTCMEPRLAEPRNVKRFFAQIEAVYPLVQDEVDFVDLILVTFLRVFYPSVHRSLSGRRAELTGTEFVPGSKPTPKEREETWRKALVEVHHVADEEAGRVWQLLSALYPALKDGRANPAHRAAGSSEYFDRYLYLAVPPDDVSDSEVDSAVREALTDGFGPACDRLIAHLSSAGEVVLDKLARVQPEKPGDARALLPFAARVMHSAPPSGILGRSQAVARIWLGHLLATADVGEVGRVVDMLVGEIGVIEAAMIVDDIRSDSVFGGRDTLPPRLEPLRDEVVRRLVEYLDGQAEVPEVDTDRVVGGLYWWARLEGDDVVRDWLRAKLDAGPWTVPEFAGLFVSLATTEGGTTVLSDFNMDAFDRWIGVDYALDRFEPAESPDPIDWWDKSDVSFGERKRRAHQLLADEAVRRRPPSP